MSSTAHPSDRPSPLEALRRRWWLAAVLPLLLGVLGYLAGMAKAPTYTGEARVAVGAGSLTSGAIAGFPQAAETLAANYARYVNSTGVTDSAMSTEGVQLSASPIPDSYVIQIEGQGADEAVVVKAVQKAADQLVKVVNSGQGADSGQATLDQYRAMSARWAQAKAAADAASSNVGKLQGKAGEAAARKVLADAQANVADLQVQMDALSQKYANQVAQASTDANLVVVRKAEITSSTKSGTAQKYLLAGLVVGALLALALALLLERRSSRRTPPVAAQTAPTAQTAPVARPTAQTAPHQAAGPAPATERAAKGR